MRVAMLRFTLQDYSALNDHRGVCDSVLLSWWAVILSAIYLMLHPQSARELSIIITVSMETYDLFSLICSLSPNDPLSHYPPQPQPNLNSFQKSPQNFHFPPAILQPTLLSDQKHVHGTLTFELTRTKIRMVNEARETRREQIQLVNVHIRRPSQWGATEVGKLGWKQDFPVFILLM